jgi:hypothetical protein
VTWINSNSCPGRPDSVRHAGCRDSCHDNYLRVSCFTPFFFTRHEPTQYDSQTSYDDSCDAANDCRSQNDFQWTNSSHYADDKHRAGNQQTERPSPGLRELFLRCRGHCSLLLVVTIRFRRFHQPPGVSPGCVTVFAFPVSLRERRSRVVFRAQRARLQENDTKPFCGSAGASHSRSMVVRSGTQG